MTSLQPFSPLNLTNLYTDRGMGYLVCTCNTHGCVIVAHLCCRIAVFSLTVLRDERVVIVAEQRPDCSEDEVSY